MADARATEEETEVDEMSIVRTGSIANHVNAKKFEMALHKSESLADYPAEKVWKHVDVDKSGGLDKKEFFEMYQLLQKHVDTQQKELVEEKHKIWESQVRLRMFKYFGLFLLFTMMLLFATNILTGYASIKLGQQFSDINSSDPILRMRDGAAAECGAGPRVAEPPPPGRVGEAQPVPPRRRRGRRGGAEHPHRARAPDDRARPRARLEGEPDDGGQRRQRPGRVGVVGRRVRCRA